MWTSVRSVMPHAEGVFDLRVQQSEGGEEEEEEEAGGG